MSSRTPAQVASSSFPQADQPLTVLEVCRAVAAGAATSGQLATRLDRSVRQVNYYRAAAERLGLLDRDGNTVALTADEHALVGANPRAQVAMLVAALAQDPLVAAVGPRGGVGHIRAAARRAGLSEVTTTRRVQTVVAWDRFVRRAVETVA